MPGSRCLPAAWRGRYAAFALAVIQGANNHREINIVLKELHQYFHPDARQELESHAAAGRTLRHAHPATGVVVLPVKADAHAANTVAI